MVGFFYIVPEHVDSITKQAVHTATPNHSEILVVHVSRLKQRTGLILLWTSNHDSRQAHRRWRSNNYAPLVPDPVCVLGNTGQSILLHAVKIIYLTDSRWAGE